VGQTRSYGDVGSMSGLPESGHDWAIYEYAPLKEERRALVGLVRVRPAEGVLSPPAQGTREALASKQPGPFPIRIARVGDLGPNEDAHSPELGRSPFWERPSRALPDPERLPRRVRRVGPRQPPLSTKRTSGLR
jgi:hypothetical protein